MKYKILSTITSVILMISLFGCQQNNAIMKPDVDMKTVTQNSLDDLVSFTFEFPSEWDVYTKNYNSLACVSPNVGEKDFDEEMSLHILNITNYIMPDIYPVADKYKQAYKDLFRGKYDGIKDLICDNIEYINIGKVMESFPEQEFESPESLMDFFNILIDGSSTPDYTMPESWEDKEWATNFVFKEYAGKNGKIVAVEYSYVIIDKTYKAINCYRDDNYSVCGVFDDDTELSSGDLALWVASTMEVAEHYRLEDGVVLREGKDY